MITADLSALVAELRQVVDGQVRNDIGARAAYSTDSSNYRSVPLAVVVPRTVESAARAVAVCRQHRAPVLSRGGGTSLPGQTTNAAVVIDWSRSCRRVRDVDPVARTCVVEPGIALDDLNGALSSHQLMFGPRPSTHVSCTLGGMIGNNSCGATAQAYGKTADNIAELEILTIGGLRARVGPTSDEKLTELTQRQDDLGVLYRGHCWTDIWRAPGTTRSRAPSRCRRTARTTFGNRWTAQVATTTAATVGSTSTRSPATRRHGAHGTRCRWPGSSSAPQAPCSGSSVVGTSPAAPAIGLEPITCRLTAGRSAELSYAGSSTGRGRQTGVQPIARPPRGAAAQARYSRSSAAAGRWRSLASVLASIWRTRSRVTPKIWPTSSRVCGLPSCRP